MQGISCLYATFMQHSAFVNFHYSYICLISVLQHSSNTPQRTILAVRKLYNTYTW